MIHGWVGLSWDECLSGTRVHVWDEKSILGGGDRGVGGRPGVDRDIDVLVGGC